MWQASMSNFTEAHRFGLHNCPPGQSLTWIGSKQSVAPLTQVTGLKATGNRWMARTEWTKRDPGHCRNCHTIADGSFGPIQTELSNAGINLHSLWREESLRAEIACAFISGGCSTPQRNIPTWLQLGMRM